MSRISRGILMLSCLLSATAVAPPVAHASTPGYLIEVTFDRVVFGSIDDGDWINNKPNAEMYGRIGAVTNAADRGGSLSYRMVGTWGKGCADYNLGNPGCPVKVWARPWADQGYQFGDFWMCGSTVQPSTNFPDCLSINRQYLRPNNSIWVNAFDGQSITISFTAMDYDELSADDVICQPSHTETYTLAQLSRLNESVEMTNSGQAGACTVYAHLKVISPA